MKKCLRPVLLAITIAMLSLACSEQQNEPDCSSDWQRYVDDVVTTADGLGHGPDIGSDEWRSVVEFKLGVRGQPGIPDRASPLWCAFIQNLIDRRQGAENGENEGV